MEKKTKKQNIEKVVALNPKKFSGVVVSDKMQKTIVVLVNNYIKHPKYKRYYNRSKKYKAHDEEGAAKMGDQVTIVETRPISKDKTFKLFSIDTSKKTASVEGVSAQ